MITHTCSINAEEVEAEGSQDQGQPWLHSYIVSQGHPRILRLSQRERGEIQRERGGKERKRGGRKGGRVNGGGGGRSHFFFQ